MLVQFLCSNFASIRDQAILSLEPAADEAHPENIVHDGCYSALGEIAIYGANASGKSNLFKAITYAINIVRESHKRQVNEPIPVIPFKLDATSHTKPSKFEFTFVAEDKRKYIYGFSADLFKVHEEYLYLSTPSGESMIFDRTGEKYEFADDCSEELESVQGKNTSNKLFLSTATFWNAKSTLMPYKWLSDGIDTFTNVYISGTAIPRFILSMYLEHGSKYTDFTKNLLKQADINIDDLDLESPDPQNLQGSLNRHGGRNDQMLMQQMSKIYAHHSVDGNDDKEKNWLSLEEESLGTRMLFCYAPLIKQALDLGKTLVIDEFERSIHPSLVKFLVNVFRSPEENRHGAQLIFTTHETTLLSRSTFRLDQIYFTEKKYENAATALYSLDEFKVSSKDDIEKGYLIGRFGAIPFLETEDF